MNRIYHCSPLAPELGSILFRHLAVAARNHAPFADVFDALGNEKSFFRRQAKRLQQMGHYARTHSSLADTLASQTGMFVPATLALIAQAEAHQQLAPVLTTVWEDYQRRQLNHHSRYPSYPVVLLVALIGLVVLGAVFVAPTFHKVFVSFGAELPFPTAVLFGVAEVLESIWWLLFPLIVVGVWLIRCNHVPALTNMFWRNYARIPSIAAYFAAQRDTRLALWMASLRHEPALLVCALQHVQATSTSPAIRDHVEQLITHLQSGQPLAQALAGIRGLSSSLVYAFRVADTGTHPIDSITMCLELMQEQAIQATERLERWTLLTSYLMLGGLVGFFVVSMYLPIFKIGSVV